MLKRWLHAANQVVVHEGTYTGAGAVGISGTVNAPVVVSVSGKSEQAVTDNSPSPEYPSPIASVVNPAVTTLGRNFYPYGGKEYTNPPDSKRIEYVGVDITGFIKPRVGKGIKVSADLKTSAATPEHFALYTNGGYHIGNIKLENVTNTYRRFMLCGQVWYTPDDPNGDTCILSTYCGYGTGVAPAMKNIVLEEVTDDTDLTMPTPYDRYRSTTATIPCTLRSLPDGTRDCLVIDGIHRKCWIEKTVEEKVLDGVSHGLMANEVYKVLDKTIRFGAYAYGNVFAAVKGSSMRSNYFKWDKSGWSADCESIFWHGSTNAHYYFSVGIPFLKQYGYDGETNGSAVAACNSWMQDLYSSGSPVIIQFALATPETHEIPWKEEFSLMSSQYYTKVDTDSALSPEISVTAKILGGG